MKKCIIIMLLIAALVFSSAPLWAEAADEVNAEVASVRGTVTVKRAASEKSFTAFVGLKLKQGDVVTVAAGGEVAINIGEDKTVKGLADSSFKISNLTGTDAASEVGFTLIKGTVFNEVRSPQSSTEGLTVRTGNTVAGVRGTTYTVSLRATDGVTVRTLKGSVFLDKVLARLEQDANASLVGEQQTVGAGEGASTTREGVYDLSMTDFTKAELEYIKDHPNDFPPDMVSDAQNLLDNWVEPTTSEEGNNQIVYETTTTTTGGGGGGDGGGNSTGGTPAPTTYYTVTFVPNPYITIVGYTPTWPSAQAAAGQPLAANAFPLAGMVGHSFDGWYEDNTTGGPRYDDGHTPITGNITLYPEFQLDPTQTGSSNYPFLITKANFPHFRYFVQDTTGLTKSYQLTETINCGDYTANSRYGWAFDWQPIGTGSVPFHGEFDGGGKTISNFSLNSSLKEHVGFFGYIGGGSSGTVKNLTLSGTITADYTASVPAPYSYAGGIAGEVSSNGLVENCHTDVTIQHTANGSGAIAFTGGIAGVTSGGSGTITNCTAAGTVSATSNNYDAYAGGIVGSLRTPGLTGCSASASVTATSAGVSYAGGIAGYADNMIASCRIASATITATGNATLYTGGIAGRLQGGGGVQNCEVGANITAQVMGTTNTSFAGGITGGMDTGTTIGNCYFSGTVQASGGSASIAGGIAGSNSGTITGCVAYSGSVTGLTAGRIWGTGSGTGSTDNYAYYENPDGFKVNNTLISGYNNNDQSGQDASYFVMSDPLWWTTTISWNTSIWDLSPTSSIPPLLLNMP